MPEENAKKSPHDILRIVLRRWRLFVLSFSLFAIAVMWISPRVWPRKYTSTAKIERSTLPVADKIIRGDIDRLQRTFEKSLAGRKAIERVVKDLGFIKNLPHDPEGNLTDEGKKSEQEIVKELKKGIRVDSEVRGSTVDIIRVEVTHPDPDLARRIATKLVQNYQSDILKGVEDRLKTTRDFLNEKVKLARKKVADVVKQRIDLESNNARMSLDRPGALQSEIDRITINLETLRFRQNAEKKILLLLRDRIQALQQPSSQPSSTDTQPVQIERENPKLRRLKSDLQNYRDLLEVALRVNHMTEKHPDVIALRDRIEVLEKRIEGTSETEIVKVYGMSDPANPAPAAAVAAQAVGAEVVSRQALFDMTTSDIERQQRRLKQLELAKSKLSSVWRQYEQILEELKHERDGLGRWQKQLEEVEVALGAETSKKRTQIELHLAQKQFLPTSPKLERVLGLALIGGLAFGGGLAFLCNWMDRTIGSTEDAMKYFALPVHGVIGEITTPRDRLRKRIRNWVLSPIVALILGCCLLVGVLNVYLWLRVPEYKGGKFVVDFLYQNVQALIPG